ncbi:hypothetical protein C2845_PM12G21500 [Panicum miliaceum]|uniref:Ubiquitin-related modifier 1 n=1 Tax=Panicum miliaceum TaxID=4540 RepID=A0A3L6QCS3_PANMI|nr:hypothetical protein C2845_PM12G21500 [Panicum miliaceum]
MATSTGDVLTVELDPEPRLVDRGQVEVFQVDVDAGKLVPTSTVGADRAVFIGSTRALSISTRLFPSIAANAVYFCIGSISMDLLFYIVHLDNGWGEPARLPYSDQGQAVGPFVDPCNLDVYLACCIDVVQVLTMRPGGLVLINDRGWELCGGLDAELEEKDVVVFISTLHVG